MLTSMMNNIKQAEATDSTQGGGSGGSSTGDSSFLTPSGGGSGVQANTTDAGTSQGTGSKEAASNANSSGDAAGSTTSDWRSQLPQELQKDATLSKFSSISSLAQSYINAQRIIGSDKVPVPGKTATEEDWKNTFVKLGLPETADKYEVKFKDGSAIPEDFTKGFKEQAYAAGILPKQAQKMAEWFSDVNMTAAQKAAEETNKQFLQSKQNLEKEWGAGYQVKVARAIKTIEDHGGKELVDYFTKSGIGADEKFIRVLANIGDKLYAEHKIVTESGDLIGGKTPQEIDAEIKTLMSEPAYTTKGHPKHKLLVDQVSQLFVEKAKYKNA